MCPREDDVDPPAALNAPGKGDDDGEASSSSGNILIQQLLQADVRRREASELFDPSSILGESADPTPDEDRAFIDAIMEKTSEDIERRVMQINDVDAPADAADGESCEAIGSQDGDSKGSEAIGSQDGDIDDGAMRYFAMVARILDVTLATSKPPRTGSSGRYCSTCGTGSSGRYCSTCGSICA